MEKRNLMIAMLASLILLFAGFATASTIINYQGLLTDSGGDPVPDNTYQMIFSIWDDSTGGTQVWTSALTSVETTNGHFSVDLGATEPLDRDMLGSGPVYLEIQVETEPPMSPRTQLNWVPYGAVSQRVLGDVETSDGSLTIQLPDAEQLPYINLNVDSAQANVLLSQGYPDGPSINMTLTTTIDGDDASLLIRGSGPAGDGAPMFDFEADDSSASMMMLGPSDGPSVNMTVTLTTEAFDAGMSFVGAEGGPTLKAGADADAAGIIIVDTMPSGDSGSINLGVDPSETGIIIVDTRGGEDGEHTSVALSADGSEAGIIIVDTKPSGDNAIVQMGANTGADLTINFTQPLDNQAHGVEMSAKSSEADVNVYFAEPLDERSHGVQIFSDSSGGNINIYQEQGGAGEEIGSPLLSINGAPGSGVSYKIFNPQPEPPGGNPAIEMSTAPGNNASIRMFQPQPEPPGNLHEAITMTTTPGTRAFGASFKMFQPQPEPPGIPASIKILTETDNTFFDVFKYSMDPAGGMDSTGMHMVADSSEVSMEFLQGANTWVKMFANEDGGGMEFFDDGSKYMGVEPSPFYNAGDLKMYDSTQSTSIIVSSLGMVSIGTGVMGNILTILRNSPTDPVADAWGVYSSRRWKRNIEPIEGSLDKVMDLRGVSFEWKADGKKDIGLVAEEVAEVIPEVVAFEENGEDAQSIDYSRLVALLIEATKEQQKEIEELQNEVNELKSKIR